MSGVASFQNLQRIFVLHGAIFRSATQNEGDGRWELAELEVSSSFDLSFNVMTSWFAIECVFLSCTSMFDFMSACQILLSNHQQLKRSSFKLRLP